MDVNESNAVGHSEILSSLTPNVRSEPESGILKAVNYGWDRRDKIIAMWTGEGSSPTPQFICQSAVQSLADGETFYTAQRGIPQLRDALARYHSSVYERDFDPENFFVTCGGMQAVQIAIQALVQKGDEIIIPTPAWPNYAAPMRMAGVIPVEVPMRFENSRWHLGLEELFAAITEKTRAIALNSPSNPIGWVMNDEEIIAIRDFCREHDIWIIADEVYGRFYYPQAGDNRTVAPSFQNHCEAEEKVIYTNTFSKNWAMTGWRMGWIQAPKSIGDQIENLIQYNTSGVAVFMQRAGVTALEQGEEFIDKQVKQCAQGLDILMQTLGTRSDIDVQPPQGAFYFFFRIQGETDSHSMMKRLMDEAAVGVAPGSAFGEAGEGWLRMCFARSHDDIREAAKRIIAWLDAR